MINEISKSHDNRIRECIEGGPKTSTPIKIGAKKVLVQRQTDSQDLLQVKLKSRTGARTAPRLAPDSKQRVTSPGNQDIGKDGQEHFPKSQSMDKWSHHQHLKQSNSVPRPV